MNSRQEIIKSYNQIHSQSEKLLEMPSFYEWILDKLGVSANSSLLDIATGAGTLVKYALQRGVEATGIDISIEAVRKAIADTVNLNIQLADGEELPFKNRRFDYVTNIGSLEHFIQPEKGLWEMHRVLKDTGKAGIFVPNSYYLGDIVTHVMFHGNAPSHNQIIERFATKNEWSSLFNQNGFSVMKIFYYNFFFPRNFQDWKFIRHRPKKILGALVSPLIPRNLSYSFYFICQKK